MEFNLTIRNIQHIKQLTFDVDLSHNKLMCIVGKNGVGKTTLIRAIKNLQETDTFSKTASPYIFNDDSSIEYKIDNANYTFEYNPKLQVIDTKSIIDENIKESIHVELPIPHGERFKHFQRLNEIDEELREKISLKTYEKPDELIDFLAKVYKSDRFNNLKEVTIKKSKYYFILKEDDFYIREDYLSSGEFFIINLYKMIQRKCKLIVIDEIDISLDASAQVHLIKQLRDFCKKYQVNIVFTTHSLALMETLDDLELHYMGYDQGIVTLSKLSYNHVKSMLFGFQGWDKYILTEDKVLEDYLTHLIAQNSTPIFAKYKIIYIGGGTNVVALMNRNKTEKFFSSSEDVISILDGDQKGDEARLQYCQNNENIMFIPFQSVEKQVKEHYDKPDRDELPIVAFNNNQAEKKARKDLYKNLVKKISQSKVFTFINEKKEAEVRVFKEKLVEFLNPNS